MPVGKVPTTIFIRSGMGFICPDMMFICSEKACISRHCTALIPAAFSATVRDPYGTYCSIFSHSPCIPDIDYPIGQTLQLTIVSRTEDDKPDAPAEKDPADRSPRDLNTIRDVFSALRACWVPPEKDAARSGTQITLRLSFNSHGGIIAEPRTTYVTTDTPPDVRQIYWNAATAALKRCTPLQFTDGLGGALAGRPFAIRFVDDRSF
ncbi:MAG: hypothetical protein WA769_25070 [Pseudolabrys sp.]